MMVPFESSVGGISDSKRTERRIKVPLETMNVVVTPPQIYGLEGLVIYTRELVTLK